MSSVKLLLDALLWDIYGKQQLDSVGDGHTSRSHHRKRTSRSSKMTTSAWGISRDPTSLQELSVRKLVDISAILKLEIRLMGYYLERILISRDRNRRHQEILCGFVDAVLQVECHDAHPTMRFSLSPPPPKATSAATSPTMQQQSNSSDSRTSAKSDDEPAETADDATSDYKQWLHAMKLVARLPGGMPPEFRRKLWLSLADKYLKSKDVLWEEVEEKCFCEKWREDDEELGIQIVKDLHRTGSNLCTGPAGNINQAKLQRILLGYARYSPEVGYCQGFNMLGALILQVMDKEESESMKVMIYLVEGVLPPGYFCGSMGGLQADMGVFRELMTSKLPRLAKHLQKLQGPIENAYEPPLTNVFTMQWFLTMFCTCLPMTCVLRVWDLVLIEGSDVLLRTALVLWSLLEERILITRTADDFYCKMGSFSSELLNGHLIDSNGLIEKVVQLGPIPDIQRLRDKHLYNIAPLRHKQGLQFYFDDEEPESDEESRLAVATVWGIPWGRRGSGSQTANSKALQSENKDRIALDISLLKKQYDRLRERQKQAHIILTTACSSAARQSTSNLNPTTLPVNQLLMGRSAIVTNKGRRIGPPLGAIPPSRKPSLPTILHKAIKPPEKQLRRGETLHWRDTDISKRRRDSLTWKEIKADRSAPAIGGSSEDLQTRKLLNRAGKSDSSSYSEESAGDGSSTDTSLCDEDDPLSTGEKAHGSSSVENSPKRRTKISRKQKDLSTKLKATEDRNRHKRPKSWAPTNDEIPFELMTSGSPELSGHEDKSINRRLYEELTMKEDEDSAPESDRVGYKLADDLDWTDTRYSRIAGDLATTKLGPLHIQADILELPVTTSASQLSPMPDINEYLNQPTLSQIPATKPLFLNSTNSLGSGDGEGAKIFDVNDEGVTNEYFERVNSVERPTNLDLFYSLSDEDSIRNAYNENKEGPERVKMALKPEFEIKPKMETSDEIEKGTTIEGCGTSEVDRHLESDTCTTTKGNQTRTELPDSSEESLAARVAETSETSSSFSKHSESNRLITPHHGEDIGNGSKNNDFVEFRNELKNPTNRKYSLNDTSSKRNDPRRLTITRSFTIETTEKYDAPESGRDVQAAERDVENLESRSQKNNVSDVVDKSIEKRGIPSTADLEDRFNRLEKQLSESKKSTENPKSVSEDDRGSQSPRSLRSITDVATSTTEPEDRYNTLERQSNKSLNAAENINEAEDENNEKKITDNDENYAFEESQVKSNTLNESPARTSPKNEIKEDEVELETPLSSPKVDNNQSRFTEISTQNTKSDPSQEDPLDSYPLQVGDKILTPNRNVSTAELKSPIEVTNSDSCPKNNTVISQDFEKHEKPISDEILSPACIPTTTDLEDRFYALERQMSSQSSSPKNTIAENKKSNEAEGKETSDRKGKEYSEKPEKTFATNSNSRTEMKNRTTKTPTDQTASDSKSSLKKIPSIAELEDRFNALERNQSLTKQTSPKNKKEPPDEIEKTNQKKITKQENRNPRTENIDNRAEDMVGSADLDKVSTKTKSPPSTEELEKRFEALGKKLSSETVTPNKEVVEVVDSEENPKHGSNNHTNDTKLGEENISEPVKRGFSKAEPGIIRKKDSKDQLLKDQSFVRKENRKTGSEESRQLTKNDSKLDSHVKKIETRRASEPPTTKDLESRYEALQRRMSSKPVAGGEDPKKKMATERTETVEEALERIEKDVLEENVNVNEPQAEKPLAKPDTTKAISEALTQSAILDASKEIPKRRSSEPPTTEELEKRYENLKKRMSIKSDVNISTFESEEIKVEEQKLLKKQCNINENEGSDADGKQSSESSRQCQDANSESTSRNQQDQESASNDLQKDSQKNPDDPIIPVPPPMQSKQLSATINSSQDNQRRALVEELRSKMTPHDENLKPSDVNPQRKASSHRNKVADDTSETHAITASRRLKKDEHSWYTQHQKVIRRFSDLPSRADLENRVYFLEQQLSLKNIKQRSASDSEVASKTRLMGSRSTEGPSTSSKNGHGSDLENRVKALETQLSENSIKLLEAMRRKPKDNSDHHNDNTFPSKPIVQASEPDSRTGMELVRYSHYGEIEETETTNPINISINIKMHLNKDKEEKQKKHKSAPTTEGFEKRLEALEEQLLKSVSLPVKSANEEELKASEKNQTEKVEELKEIDGGEFIQIVEEEHKIQPAKESLSDKINAPKDSNKINASEKAPSRTEDDKARADDRKGTDDSQLKLPRDEDTLRKEKDAAKKQTQSGKDNKEIKIQHEMRPENPEVELQSITKQSETVTDVKTGKLQSNVDVDVIQGRFEGKPVDEPDSQATTRASVEEKSPKKIATKSAQDEQKKTQPNNSNMVLLLDNEPKPGKVRRLTRANTEELEGLLQALEKQLHDRNLIKSNDGKLIRADSVQKEAEVKLSEESKSISDLSKEIQEFTRPHKEKSMEKKEKSVDSKEKLTEEKEKSVDKKVKSSEKEEDYDWGPDPVKRHLKRSTVYLPSTKELVARYRSLERQIRLLEDVECIDVEQRLNEIERKIKLQYSLSHEKDLFKFLDLCEGKLPDDEPDVTTSKTKINETSSLHSSPSRSCLKDKTPYTSPARSRERTPYTSPSRSATRSPYTSPARHRDDTNTDGFPTTEDLEYRYRVLDLVRSKSKDNLTEKSKQKSALKKQPIHPLEMLLDPSPVESDVPTTGELEHRMRVLNEKHTTPSPPRTSRHRSPTIDDIKRVKIMEDRRPKTPIHDLETLVASPTKKDLPTEEELEARMRALEEDKKFDFKMQKNYKEFNQKLKDVISPSLSFEEFKAAKSREQSPKRPLTPKSAIKDHEAEYKLDEGVIRSTSPKMIRFREDDRRSRSSASVHDIDKMVGTSDGVLKIIEENSKMLHRILKKTLADSNSSSLSDTTAVAEGLEILRPRLMRETSPLRRTGTHTGVPLRTDDNINDRLNSIKNTIKSIDSLCEEKPYRREKCQRYIDSLFSDSVYFTSPSKKSSLEDLAYKRRSGDYAPSIHVSEHSSRPSSDHYLSRSVGSTEFIRSTSPLRAASPLHHRSTRDLRRDVSPRRRYGDEEREEYESRVRTRANLLPNYYLDDSRELLSRSSLTKFQKVDKELDTYKFDDKTRSSSRSMSRSPLRSTYGLREETSMLTNRNSTTLNNSHTATTTPPTTTATSSRRLDLDRPVSSYHQASHSFLPNSTTPYSPAKLEIRHTTVTSTFYDRLLTEKQIEKSLSRPSSSSPVVSPSVAPKSYLDIMPGSSITNQKSSGNSPTTPVRSTVGAAGFGLAGSANSFQARVSSDPASLTTNTSTSLLSNAINTATTTPTGNSSVFPNSYRLARLPPVNDNNSTELAIRSSENILMQLKSSPSAGAGTVLQSNAAPFTTTTTSTIPANIYTSVLNTNPTDPTKSCVSVDNAAATITTASTSHLSSVGVYNPLMPLNLRPAPEIGMQFNHLQSTTTSSTNPLNYGINLPKS